MTNRVKTPRKRKTVKLRTNGKHAVQGATIKAPLSASMRQILRGQAQFRWLGPQLAAITPQYIEQTLIGAMSGAHVQQWSLFDVMLKTWPELSACYDELIRGVQRKNLVFEAYREEDEEPTPSAIEKQKVVSCAVNRMQPDPTTDCREINGTIAELLDAWFRGVAVSEIVWQIIDDPTLGTIQAPQYTYAIDTTNYGFNNSGVLGLRTNTKGQAGVWPYQTTSIQPQPSELVSFDTFPNKFLIAMHKASAGGVVAGALLRPLAWWWCAANFSSDWLLNLAQVFGLPFRWANYDPNAPQATIDAVCQMLQNMGSAGWAAFPAGTTLEMINAAGQQGSDHSPQGELLDRADRYARSLIMGQTMTGTHGTTGKGGGQAFGEVEADVKHDRIEAAGDWVCEIINQQLIPAILTLNYGETSEKPTVKFIEDDEAGQQEAMRDKTLADMGLEIGVDHLRKKYDIPEPAEGEETVGGAPEPMPGLPAPNDPNAPQATIDAVFQMLQNMGSAGWAAFPAGTTLEMINAAGQQGSDHSPQGELLDRADRYARSLIMGQTMTGTHGTTGKGGGQAFGEVEADVKHDRIEAAGDWVCEIINQQLIPAILTLNYGETSEKPTVKFIEDDEAGQQEAMRDKTLADMGLEIGVDHLRKKYDIPEPSEGEETVGGAPEPMPGMPGQPNDPNKLRQDALQNRIAKLNEIKDDALFAKRLQQLAEAITK